MTKTVSIPLSLETTGFIKSDGAPIFFPDKCVYCCRPKEKTHDELKVELPTSQKNKSLRTRPPVPYCKKHYRLHWWYFGFLIFVWMVFSLINCVALYHLLKSSGVSSSIKFLILAGSCLGGLIISMIEVGIVNRVLVSVFRSLRDLSFFDVFTRTGALGFGNAIRVHMTPDQPDTYTYECTFANEQYAAEFEQLNTTDVQS